MRSYISKILVFKLDITKLEVSGVVTINFSILESFHSSLLYSLV